MGPPGVGKTRLVEQSLPALAQMFGAVLKCTLATASSSDEVVGAVASALGFAAEIHAPIRRLAHERFGEESVVLVIDNCEHVRSEAAETIESLVDAATGMRIVATSRERLGVAGERAWMLRPMTDADSVALLSDRVRAFDARFAVTAENATALAEICARLGHLPLALELVAPRLALLPVAQVGALLDTSTYPTITAAIDWSVGLLGTQVRGDLFRLGVFPGTFGLESAAAVLDSTSSETVDRLGALRDASLLVADTSGESATFRLLEPIRQYAMARLAQNPSERDARHRHAAYVLKRTVWIGEHLLGSTAQLAALATFEETLPDIRAAFAWAVDAEPATAAGIIAATSWAWEITSRLREGEALLRRTMPLATNSDQRARVLTSLASLVGRRIRPIPEELTTAAVAEARAAGNQRWLAFALCFSTFYDASSDAADRLDEVATIARQTNDTFVFACERYFRGTRVGEAGDVVKARDLFAQAIQLFESIPDGWLVLGARVNFIFTLLQLGDLKTAKTELASALALLLQHPNWLAAPLVLYHAAFFAAEVGRPDDALRMIAARRRLMQELGTESWDTSEIEGKAAESIGDQSLVDRYLIEGGRLSLPDALRIALGATQTAMPRQVKKRDPLTPRERQVVRLVADGLTNREIASKLFIAERSAEGHLERIRNKLGLHSRTQIATWAFEHGLGGKTGTDTGISRLAGPTQPQ